MMDLSIKEISIENEKINREKFFWVGFCPEIQRYLLCVHISWVVGYDRYYAIDEEDIALYEESPDEFCQKYAKEINAYRTERLLGAGALRDYDFRCLPDEILKSLDGYPSFKRYCALPGFVDSKNEEKTERNAGYLVVSQSGGGMLRQGTREGIRRTPANRGMRAHRVVKGLDISEDVCHGLCP